MGTTSALGTFTFALKRYANPKTGIILAFTFILVLSTLILLLPLNFTSNIIAPYLNKASDYWNGAPVLPGREATRGGLAFVGRKESFRSRSLDGFKVLMSS